MDTLRKCFLLLAVVFSFSMNAMASESYEKMRVLVLTDIENDQDDAL